MAIRNIRYDKDEILKKKSKEVTEINDKIRYLAQDMLDTMYDKDGIGLAACQVGMLKRIITYDVSYIEEGAKKKPVVMINPKIKYMSKSMVVVEEGCLSFPNIYKDIKRHEKIKVEYTDLDNKKIVKNLKGMEAIVVQHECDHLDGIVFLDRLKGEICF